MKCLDVFQNDKTVHQAMSELEFGQDPKIGFHLEIQAPTPGVEPRFFVLFGGIAGKLSLPPFEFYSAGRILSDHKLFLRDIRGKWYQRGVAAVGPDAQAVAEFIGRKFAESGAREIVFVGNSMGGYAALLFCGMLRTGRAIAFAPQTFVDPHLRQIHGDDRWAPQLAGLHEAPQDGDILDLLPFLQERHPDISADIHVAWRNRLDFVHARHLGDALPGVRVHKFDQGGHDLVKKLRDDGLLAAILAGD